eukprot:scaffold585_cov48-Phaeocystis_antarctica.AAC.1
MVRAKARLLPLRACRERLLARCGHLGRGAPRRSLQPLELQLERCQGRLGVLRLLRVRVRVRVGSGIGV